VAREIRTLGRHALVYGAGIAVGRLAGFIMLPIYTSFLTPTDYGTLELLTLTTDFLGTIASAGIAAAVYKFYADAKTEAERRSLISTATLSLSAFMGILAVAGCLAAAPLSDVVLRDVGDPRYFRLFFLIYFFQTVESIPLLYLRARNRSVVFAVTNVARLIVSLGLNIYFVVVLRYGVLGVLYSNLITAFLFSSGLSIHLFRDTGIRFAPAWTRKMVRYGIPLVPWTLSNFLIVFSDRYFLKNFTGNGPVGVYSLAFRFAMLLNAFGFRPFNLVWGPQRFEVVKQPDGMATIRRVFEYLNLLLGYVALLIVLFAGDVIRLMARKPGFHAAAGVVPILVAAQILYHLVTFPNLSMLVTERTKVLAWLSILTGAIVLGLNFALIPPYGIYGAAYATLIAYALRFLIILAVAQRIRPFEYGWRRVGLIYLVLAVPAAIEIATPVEGIVASLALGVALAVVAAAGLYTLVLDAGERTEVRAAPGKLIRRLRRRRSPA